MIYLDNAATTKIDSEVLGYMMPYLQDEYGNAGALYSFGRNTMKAVSRSREQVAKFFGCRPEHVVFTSGGSEGNNMAIKGMRRKLEEIGKKHIVVSAVEHSSVLRAVEELQQDGFDITYVKPGANGAVSPESIGRAISGDTGFVSVMYANNETGALNDVRAIGDICKNSGALFHCDCVQAAGQFPLNVVENEIDFATISGHKIHAPKGVGAICVRNEFLTPLICGGSAQEHGIRGGTENVAGIVALGAACEIAMQSMNENMSYITSLKLEFLNELRKSFGVSYLQDAGIHKNSTLLTSPGKVLSLHVRGVFAESLVLLLETREIFISAGSACESHESKPSHVLLAQGLSGDDARECVRISFSKFNTKEEVGYAAHQFAECVKLLREN